MDSEEDIDRNRLSEVVSDILKCEGFFMDEVEVHRSMCLLSEKMIYDLYGETMIRCGSFMAEGSSLLGSDCDYMSVDPGYIAIDGSSNFVDENMHIFTMALDNCSPGYTKLEVHNLNQKCISNIQSLIEKDGNRHFFSSEGFLNCINNNLMNIWAYPYGNARFYLHGPCSTASVNNLKGTSGNTEFDITSGIKCLSWPVVASEWKYRPRSNGWPSQEIVDRITLFHVHVMPIGEYESNNSSIQWRFAFTKAERGLIWNFNDIQFQCYVLMKSILKCKLQPFSPDQLTVYQMKNLLFWVSEEYGVKNFTKANLLRCLEICLKRFKQHILKGSLPHYILRDRNLLAGKLDSQTRQLIANEIDTNLEDIFVTILECSHIVIRSYKFLFEYNINNKESKRNFKRKILKAPLGDYLMRCQKRVESQIVFRSRDVFLPMINHPNNLEKLLEFIIDINSGKNRSNTVLPSMVKTTTRFGFIQLGMMLTNASYKIDKTPEEIDCYIWVTHFSFKVGFDLDELSGKLYLVTFALLNNKIDTASAILSPIMNNYTKPFIYAGYCMRTDNLWVLQLSNSDIVVINDGKVDAKILYSHDMYFPTNVVHFVPDPVKYELSLQQCKKQSNSCFCHPVVYAFYLMFEIARKKNEQMNVQNEILRKLSSFIQKCEGGYERHISYNLLGYSYYVCGRIDEAVATFGLSMHEKSDSTNVAVYHLCIIVLENVTSKAAVV